MAGRRPGELSPVVAWTIIIVFVAAIAAVYIKLTTPPPREPPTRGRGSRVFGARNPKSTPLSAEKAREKKPAPAAAKEGVR